MLFARAAQSSFARTSDVAVIASIVTATPALTAANNVAIALVATAADTFAVVATAPPAADVADIGESKTAIAEVAFAIAADAAATKEAATKEATTTTAVNVIVGLLVGFPEQHRCQEAFTEPR